MIGWYGRLDLPLLFQCASMYTCLSRPVLELRFTLYTFPGRWATKKQSSDGWSVTGVAKYTPFYITFDLMSHAPTNDVRQNNQQQLVFTGIVSPFTQWLHYLSSNTPPLYWPWLSLWGCWWLVLLLAVSVSVLMLLLPLALTRICWFVWRVVRLRWFIKRIFRCGY